MSATEFHVILEQDLRRTPVPDEPDHGLGEWIASAREAAAAAVRLADETRQTVLIRRARLAQSRSGGAVIRSRSCEVHYGREIEAVIRELEAWCDRGKE